MGLDLSTVLPDAAVVLDLPVADWREAVVAAGDALVRTGCATDAYTREMLEAIESLGPYIVVAPGIAIAHSRPSEAVLQTGMSWIRLDSPVEFGHARNDPVQLVIGLAARDHQGHLQAMSAIAATLADKNASEELALAESAAEVRALISRGPALRK